MRRGVLSFGNIELDLERYQLRRSGRAVKIERQPMELLILLAENQGRLILREEIVASLWGPNVFLDTDQSINSAIRKIRAALKDDPDHPRYVLTVVGKGYRFICPVQSSVPTAEVTPVIAKPEAISAAPTPATSSGTAQSRWHYTRLAICLAALLVFPSAWLIYLQAHTAVPGIHSIAVLPLADFSANHDQEYFSAGITDAIITDLARIDGLRVISHNSANAYQRTNKPLRQIANELNIDAVVEGGVVRSGTRVRITAQLIRARDERPLWADAYEGDLGDLLSLQNRVAGDIARKVNAKLAQPRPQNVRPVQPGAYEAYLRGRYFFDRRSANKSVGYFRQAVSMDPQYAPAYAGLARALVSEASVGIACPVDVMVPAREAARHALGLEPELAEAYIALAQVDMTYDWNWTAASRDLTRARELSPNDPLAELNQGFYFSCLSRHDDALRHIRRALVLDPVSFFCNRMYASSFAIACMHRYSTWRAVTTRRWRSYSAPKSYRKSRLSPKTG